VFDIWNKVFSLNFDMDNINQSTILGNFKWNFVKHMKNSDLYSSLEAIVQIILPFPLSHFSPNNCTLYLIKTPNNMGELRQVQSVKVYKWQSEKILAYNH